MSIENPTAITAPLLAGPADWLVSRDPLAVLSSSPLGAGLGVAIFDPEVRVGGLLHALLPDSGTDPARAAERPGFFLDTGLATLLGGVLELGARPERLLICAAGGGRILDESADFKLGGCICDALHCWLAGHGMKLHAEETGGVENWILRLNLPLGQIRARRVSSLEEQILCAA
jgi:chemotaxis protein CheD